MMLGANLLGYLANRHTDGPLIRLWALIALGSMAFLVVYLRSMAPGQASPPRATKETTA